MNTFTLQVSSPSKHRQKYVRPRKENGDRITRVPVDNFDISAIGNIVNSIYDVCKQVPTLNKILATAKQDLHFKGSRTTLGCILKKKLGYRFKKCRQNKSVIERDNIKACF